MPDSIPYGAIPVAAANSRRACSLGYITLRYSTLAAQMHLEARDHAASARLIARAISQSRQTPHGPAPRSRSGSRGRIRLLDRTPQDAESAPKRAVVELEVRSGFVGCRGDGSQQQKDDGVRLRVALPL